MSKIKDIQKQLGIPITGVLDEFTQSAWKNYCLKNNIKFSPLVPDDEDPQNDDFEDLTTGFLNSDLTNKKVITKCLLDKGQFFEANTKKEYLFLHFTAGWDNPYNVVSDWNLDSRGQIGTQFVIGGRNPQTLSDKYDGQILECFPNYGSYAWHLGVGNTPLHRNSIGIEICNVGPLKKQGNDYFMWANKKIQASEVIDLKAEYRGYRYFHKLTDDQLTSLLFLIRKIGNDTGIDVKSGLAKRLKTMDKFKAFDYDQSIRDGKQKGLFVHTNVSPINKWGGYEKWDWPPMDGLLDVINSI